MSCFFCDSNYHVSHNCDIHFTNSTRWNFLDTKNCCRTCLTICEENSTFRSCENCQRNRKCYICFSKGHHTVYCLERFTAPKMFPPNIDPNLLFRFVRLLTFDEKYILYFSFPSILDLIKPMPLKIIENDTIQWSNIDAMLNSDLIVADKLIADNNTISTKKMLNLPSHDSIISNSMIFRFQHLDFQRSTFSTSVFLQLLSSKTKVLQCREVKFCPNLEFRQILEKGPNLEDVDIHQTNIVSTDSWPDDLLRLDSKLKCLTLTIPEFDFDVESLAKYMMKRKAADIYLYIQISQQGPFYKNEAFKMVTEKLSNYFVPDESFLSCQNLTVTFERKNNNSESKRFQLKNV